MASTRIHFGAHKQFNRCLGSQYFLAQKSRALYAEFLPIDSQGCFDASACCLVPRFGRAGRSKAASSSDGNSAIAATVLMSTGDDRSPCDRHLISKADVQTLLTGPITAVKLLPSDANSCTFTIAGFSSILVILRPSGRKRTLESWHKGPVTPLPGVGDNAVWEADLKEVVATRSDRLCAVTAMGPEVKPATAETEGAICNNIFAQTFL